jgi:hypothetical protein
MSPLRLVATACLSSVATFLVLHAAGCGTKAVGVNDCREIEEARCEAAAHCGDQIPVDDVDACKRFYRDQCLHGLATENDPSSSAVRDCVAAIAGAGHCAADTGADTLIGECDGGDELDQWYDKRIETVCDVIEKPQYTAACYFLNDTDEEPPSGGDGGAPGNPFAGGSSGANGAAGAQGTAGTSDSAGAGN